MSWLTFKTRRGVLKIKPRWQMRTAERNRQVRVIDLGLFLITWWSHEDLRRHG
ncbi:hypothetical protein [Devosia chinhatensis]|uniref:hypothetical protein n=1 Tax=Devosia chinhatensis TaxID=429727 RepID=UPI000AF12518|nr:hypothetical protein [Devosia chinhatensis]